MSDGEPLLVRRSEKSRLAIFDATLELISEIGYERLTIDGIAARASVGKQTLYRWWGSKAALVADVVLSTDSVFVWPDRRGDQTAEQDLDDWTIEMVRAYTTEPRISMMRAVLSARSADPTVAERVDERFGRPALRRLADILQEVAPEADPLDVAVAAEMFIGAFTQRGIVTTQAITEDFGRTVLKTLLRGLRTPSEPSAFEEKQS